MNSQKLGTIKLNRPWLLPVELFQTPSSYYIFDASRVNFLEVNEVVYKIVSILKHSKKGLRELTLELPEFSAEDIRDALDDIKEIQSQDYLKLYDFQRTSLYKFSDIKKHLTSNLKGLYLNITSKCNLACSYCVFGGDYSHLNDLDELEMTWETARKAMDFFLLQASKEGDLGLDFFGGEPLLSFPLVKRIVNTLKGEVAQRNQQLRIAISSNGTVINEQIIDFLIENDIFLQISLDGEKCIHDSKRRFKSNNIGSFDVILKNLQLIFDRSEEYFLSKVRLKAVITTESLGNDGADFFKIPLINELSKKGHFTMLNQLPHYDPDKDVDFFSRMHILGKSLLQKRDASNIEELVDGLGYKKRNLFYSTFYDFFTCQVTNSVYFDMEQPVPFSKNCLIGYEGCVNVDGSISICYKANSFVIGNAVEKTWYFDRIEEYQRQRHQLPQCKNCFAQRFCKLCYEKMSGKDEQLEASLQKFCQFTRSYYRLVFDYMLRVQENNPALWDEIQRMAEESKDELLKRRRKSATA